jgi:hypothetical protein
MFSFRIDARAHYMPDSIRIVIRYGWLGGVDSELTEIVPKERFCTDKRFAEYVLDSLLDKAKQVLWEREMKP